MKLLIDHQLPEKLAEHLRRRGHDCTHVSDLAMSEADDATIWNHAVHSGAVLVTKDEDFLIFVDKPRSTGQLIWVRLGNCRNAALPAAFDRVHDDLVREIDAGRRVVEVR
jgi:predicted nuclease of predicted toxin-antitoxin system